MRGETGKETWSQNIEGKGEMDAPELHARKLNAKEVLTAAKKWKFHIPNRRWNS